MDLSRTSKLGKLGVAAVGLWLAAGCATKKPATGNYTFFPGPPEEPRIQYLMSYGSEKDLGGRGRFNAFIVGSQEVYRPIWKPYGVTIRNGKVYVCDTQAGNISIADLSKGRLEYLKPQGQGVIRTPINVAVDKEGTCYVTDIERGQVLIYGKDKSLKGQIGAAGEMKPCGIALAGDRMYVTDLKNKCVRVYNRVNHDLLFSFPKNPVDENSKLFGPTNVAVERDRIYVTDTQGFVVKVFDQEGKWVRTIGEQGTSPGQFALPKGVGADREGRVYALDAAVPIIQLFDPEGKLLLCFGQPNSSGEGGLYLPAGLCVDYDHVSLFQKYVAPGYKLEYLILVTNQVGPRKVSVYGFLRKATHT